MLSKDIKKYGETAPLPFAPQKKPQKMLFF
jgi:hypothetical protein